MATDLQFSSLWPVEQSFSYSSMLYAKIEGDLFLEKAKANLSLQTEERVPNGDPHLELDDVLMLDDIREFSMRNGFTLNAETDFHSESKSSDTEKSLSSPLKEGCFPSLEEQSSQFGISPIKSPDEYLPSTSDMSHSDTFQDLSIFMPQGSTIPITSNPLASSSYSTSKSFSDNSSSSSQFTNLSYTNDTLSVIEGSSNAEFKTILTNESSTDNSKITKCTELKVFKQVRHKDIRKKNNLASQRSRMTRKEREREMESKEKFLEQENQMLRIKVAKLEELTGALKNQLFRSVLGR